MSTKQRACDVINRSLLKNKKQFNIKRIDETTCTFDVVPYTMITNYFEFIKGLSYKPPDYLVDLYATMSISPLAKYDFQQIYIEFPIPKDLSVLKILLETIDMEQLDIHEVVIHYEESFHIHVEVYIGIISTFIDDLAEFYKKIE